MGMASDEDYSYLSPELMGCLKMRQFQPKIPSQPKSDLFSLGLCCLEAALEESVSSIYDYESIEISKIRLQDYLEKLQALKNRQPFSETFLSLLRSMLEFDETQRINLQDVLL
jgi:serine/threonine protein kinase